MKNKIVVANWKMYGDFEFTMHYFKHLCDEIFDDRLKIIVCPPYPFINIGYRILFENEVEQICIGSQDVSCLTDVSSTGEISCAMLNEIGAKFSIIGHSERRKLCDNDDIVNKKLNILNNMSSITPILCIGEDEDVYKNGDTIDFILKQLKSAVNGVGKIENILIAYEPIWAIGSNKTPTKDEIIKIANAVKTFFKNEGNVENLYILYGGSVNGANIKDFLSINEIDGVLVGGYSLKIHEFCETLKHINVAEFDK